MLEGKSNYETAEEAQAAVLDGLEKKYNIRFSTVGEGEYAVPKSKSEYVYRVRIRDAEGVEAMAFLPQNGEMDDTYSGVFYTRMATDAIEPLFEGEPFKQYMISVHNPSHAGGDLSQTIEEFFESDGEVYYCIDIILEDNQTEDTYIEILTDFYTKLRTEQKLPFCLDVFANGVEILTLYYTSEEGYTPQQPKDDINDAIHMGSTQKMPDEKWMTWDYRINEMHPWVWDEYSE